MPGDLRAGEIAIIALVPFAFKWINDSREDYRKVIYGMVWCLVGLTFWHGFADLLLGTPQDRTIDVTATFAFTGMKLFVFSAFVLRTPMTAIPLVLGLAVGNYVFIQDLRTSAAILRAEYWDLKVARWGGPLIVGCVQLIGIRFRLLAIISMFMYGAVAAIYGARSHGLLMVMSLAIPFIVAFAKRSGIVGEKRSLFKLAAIGIFMGFVMAVVYVKAGQAGFLTEKSQQQLRSIKNPYNPIELIWSGRAGTIIGIVESLENPIFGTGSMTFDSNRYAEVKGRDRWKILHSVIVESMVYAGLPTLIFWFLFMRYLFTLYPITPPDYTQVSITHIVATFAFVALTWTLFFSPLVSVRFDLPVYVSLLVYCSLSTSGVVRR